jgi:hypothetical protein
MMIHAPLQHHGHHICMTLRALTHSAPLAFLAFPCYMRGYILLETIRPTAHQRVAMIYETPLQQATSFCPIALTPSRSPCSGPRISRLMRSGTPPLDRVHPLGLTSVLLQALAPTGCNFPLTVPQFPRETALLPRAHSISRGFLGWITSHLPDPDHPSIYGGGLSTPTRAPRPANEATSPELRQIPPITSIEDWAHMLLSHTHEEFATLATLQSDHVCPPCRDVSGTALIRPSHIHHYVYGEW